MTFLNPAILFGLLAASIPILIHLLNLRKLKKIEFSTLQFLKELQKNKIRKIKLKQWLLLALRVLIILCIVTAFARPTLVGVSIGGTTSAAKTSAVFILDDTFSMSVIDQNGSYLNQAKEAIKELFDQFEEGDEVGLILVSHQTDEVEMTSNIGKFKEDIDDINVSFASGKLNNTIVKAAEVMSITKNFNKEIYIFTDFQKGRLALEEEIIDLKEELSEQVRIYTFDYSGKEVTNFGIDELKINTQIFEKDKPVKFNALIKNYSKRSKNNLVVSLFINGERSAQQSVNLNPGESKTVNLEAPAKSFGINKVFVEIEEDELMQDNQRYTSIYLPEKIPVLIIIDNSADSKLLEIALKSVSRQEYFNITTKSAEQVSGIQLSDYKVLVIISSDFLNAKEKLTSFLNSNKGIIILPASDFRSTNFIASLNALGVPATGTYIKTDRGQSIQFSEIDFQHPLFENIFIDEKKKQFESPDIYSYYKINPAGKGKTIIFLEDESSFLSEYSLHGGTILLFSCAPVFSWGDFPVKSIFPPLITKSVMYLATKNFSDEKYLAGENLNVNISQRTLPQIKVIKPDNTEDIVNLETQLDSDFLTYSNTLITGNYEFYSGEELLSELSVNTDPAESVTEYLSESEFDEYLEKIYFNGRHIRIDKNENPTQMILQARFGSELWRYFLLAAIVLALLEMTIARNTKKELIEVTSK